MHLTSTFPFSSVLLAIYALFESPITQRKSHDNEKRLKRTSTLSALLRQQRNAAFSKIIGNKITQRVQRLVVHLIVNLFDVRRVIFIEFDRKYH